MFLKDLIKKLKEMPNMVHNVKGINSYRGGDSIGIELALGDEGFEVYEQNDNISGEIPVMSGRLPKSTHELADLLQHFIDEELCLEDYDGGYVQIYDISDVNVTYSWGDYGDCVVRKVDNEGIHSNMDSIKFIKRES